MENIPVYAVRRAGEIARTMDSEVFVTYILEEEVFQEVEKQSTHVITEKTKEDFVENLKDAHRKNAHDIIRKQVNEDLGFEPEEFRIREGAYYSVTTDSVEDLDIDVIFLEYSSFDLFKYSIMDRSPVPIWIVRKLGPIKKIGLFCTNLAPNMRAPAFAVELGKRFDSHINAYYIEDENGTVKKSEPAKIEKRSGVKFNKIVKGDLETEIYKISKNEEFDLIILGRIKKIGFFDLRSKFAKKTKCSVILIN